MHLSDGPDRGMTFNEEYGWSFPTIDDENWEQAAKYGVAGHPATVLVDEHGRIAGGFYGKGDEASWDELAALLDADSG